MSGQVTFTRCRCKYAGKLSSTLCVFCTIIISCSFTSKERICLCPLSVFSFVELLAMINLYKNVIELTVHTSYYFFLDLLPVNRTKRGLKMATSARNNLLMAPWLFALKCLANDSRNFSSELQLPKDYFSDSKQHLIVKVWHCPLPSDEAPTSDRNMVSI